MLNQESPSLVIRDGKEFWSFPGYHRLLPRVRGGAFVETDPPASLITVQEPPPVAPPAPVFTEADVRERLNQARSEERQKLYEERQREHEELVRLRQEREVIEAERARVEKERADAAAEAQRRAEEEELGAKDLIAKREAELRAEMEAQRAYFQNALDTEKALREKEAEFAALAQYREQVLAANADLILPQLRDLVQGASREAIDASVQGLIERSQSVLADIRQVGQEQLRSAPGVSTRNPSIGPEAGVEGQRTFSAADIQNWTMAEYQQYRSQLAPGRAGGSDRGLF